MEDRVQQGNAPDCFVKDFLQSPEIASFDEIERRMLVSGLLAAGAETTATTLQWFFKAVLSNPGAVQEAQKELDAVVGRNRLPEWQDQSSLPYLQAFISELHRLAITFGTCLLPRDQ